MNTFTYRRNPEDSSKIADLSTVTEIVRNSQKAVKTYEEIQKLATSKAEFSSLNAERDKEQGLKGFIIKSLEDDIRNQIGHRAIVIDDNGLADLVIESDGKAFQIKCDYLPGQIDFAKYKEGNVSRFMLNNNHANFKELVAEAKKYGFELEPTTHSAAECQMISDGMQLEYKITGNPKDFFIPHAYTKQQAFNLIAQRGVAAAQAAAKFGGALAVSVGMVEVLSGNKTVEEAAKDAFNATADAAFYCAAGNMVMSTALGPVVTSSLASVANGIAGALSSTAVGTQLVVAGTTVTNAAGAASAAGAIFSVGGATATAITEVTSLASSGAYALGMGSVSSGILALGGGVATALGAITGGAAVATGIVTTGITTAATAAVGSLLCPPVAVGMALYGFWRFLRD